MTREEIESLREKAKAATPGPWDSGSFCGDGVISYFFYCVETGWKLGRVFASGKKEQEKIDVNFISAASPDVILKLLEGYDRRGELLKDLVDILYCYSTGVSFASEEKPGVLLSNIRKELGLKE